MTSSQARVVCSFKRVLRAVGKAKGFQKTTFVVMCATVQSSNEGLQATTFVIWAFTTEYLLSWHQKSKPSDVNILVG